MKLSDFGLCRSRALVPAAGASYPASIAMDAHLYTAPEVLVGIPVKHKMSGQPFSDVWSLSCCMLEWISACSPWNIDMAEDAKRQIKSKQKSQTLPERLHDIPTKVQDKLIQGLCYEYRHRASAAAMQELMGKSERV